MWWNDYGPGPWMFGPMFIFFFMLAACLIMMLFMMRRSHRHSHGDSAAQILKERYARGEIDKNEYEERRRVLGV